MKFAFPIHYPSQTSLYSAASRIKRVLALLFAAACFTLGTGSVRADPKVPDLTKGEKPVLDKKMKNPLSGNLGPTGLLGWVYHSGVDTDLSRQILVTDVAQGSPASGIIQKGDVILGVSGESKSPGDFTSNARKSFAHAIAEAEANNPANLYLKVWRQGMTDTLTIKLQHMGAYAPQAPYDCPKTRNVIKRALAHLETNEGKCDRFGLNALALLACDDESFPGGEARMKKAREWVTSLIPDKKQYEGMISGQVETFSKVAWSRSYHLITMAEYHLATGENPEKDGVSLLMAIDAHAQTIARGQSMFGTMGHQFAKQGENGSIHGPYAVGYGPVNATGLAAFLGLTLARDCKLPGAETNARIKEAIDRAATFFSFYTHRGTIPYGEHAPWKKSHSANGKSGLAATAFARIPGRENDAKYFSQVSVASGTERPGGHGGSYFNYLWTPIGAHAGGKEAAAAHFRQIAWHLDLARTWDGGFYYNDYGNPGYHGPTFGKAGLYMSSPALLTYASGLRKLHITGKGWNGKTQLSQGEIDEANLASNYNPSERSTDELIGDLGNFSAVVREKAALALAAHKDDAALRSKLQVIALDNGHRSRRGVVSSLGLFEHADCATLLVRLFQDPDPYVREEAIESFGKMPPAIQAPQVDVLLKMAADLKRPPMQVNQADPMNTTLCEITLLLFDNKGILDKNLNAVEKHSSRERMYEAFRAMATLPSGGIRGKLKQLYPHLTPADIKILGDTILELVHVEAPADAMFAEGIRSASAMVLLEHRFNEGVEASLDLFKVGGTWTRVELIRAWGKLGPTIKTHKLWPEVETALKNYNDSQFKEEAVKALAAVNSPKAKAGSFITLK